MKRGFVPVLVGVIAILLIVGGVLLYKSRSKTAAPADTMATTTAQVGVGSTNDGLVPSATSTSGTQQLQAYMSVGSTGGTYEAYSFDRLSRAAHGGEVVLFYYSKNSAASREIDANIRAGRNFIPLGLTILEVDYDQSPQIRSWFEVDRAPTFVQIDPQGKLYAKWESSRTLHDIVANVNMSLGK